MSDDGSVLSQAEIDALFRQATGMNIARPAPAAPAGTATATAQRSGSVVTPASQGVPRDTAVNNPRPINLPAPPQTTVPAQIISPPPASAVPPQHTVRAEEAQPAIRKTAAPVRAEGIPADLQRAFSDLTKRILRLEEAVAEISCRIDDGHHAGAGRVSPDVSGLSRNLNNVIKRVNSIQQKLENTPDYNLSAEFECAECGSHGHTALPVMCTKCGSEGWWGYWPKDDEQGDEDVENS